MTSTAPVGWPTHRPGVAHTGPSPEPVGWQGISTAAAESLGGDAVVTVVNPVVTEQAEGPVGADVSRETPILGHFTGHIVQCQSHPAAVDNYLC